MKSKLIISLATLFLSVCSLCSNAQTSIPNGKAQLIEFTNATAKFKVPLGKTWTIHSAFTSYPDDDNSYGVSIKSINGIIQADISNKKIGKLLFSSNLIVNIQPLVLPENTSLELIITKRVGEIRSLYDRSAFLNYTETEN